jgi:hypothetical protein
MQTVIPRIAFDFIDDAVVLTTGFARISADLALDAFAAARNRMMAPVDHLARTCDVAGIIPARDAANTRSRERVAKRQKTGTLRRMRDRLDLFGIFATFRALRDLT